MRRSRASTRSARRGSHPRRRAARHNPSSLDGQARQDFAEAQEYDTRILDALRAVEWDLGWLVAPDFEIVENDQIGVAPRGALREVRLPSAGRAEIRDVDDAERWCRCAGLGQLNYRFKVSLAIVRSHFFWSIVMRKTFSAKL